MSGPGSPLPFGRRRLRRAAAQRRAPARPAPVRPAPEVTGAALGLVFAGGALGTLLRVLVTALSPAGLLLVNVTGAFALGVVVARTGDGSRLRWFLGPGLLGAYTTFSAFALELARADAPTAIVVASKTVVLGLLAAALGLVLGRRR